jgi:thymidylate kinase
MTGVLICLVGIDGSGKTTLAKELLNSSGKRGLRMQYVWGKFESRLLKLLIALKNLFLVREANWKENYARSRNLKSAVFRNRFARGLYEAFVWPVYWMQITAKVSLPLRVGRHILCDRYLYDTVVDLAMDLQYSEEELAARISRALRFFPWPDLMLYIRVPADVAFARKQDIPSLGVLEEKRVRYEGMVQSVGGIILDGTKPLPELTAEAESFIPPLLREVHHE